MTASAGSGCPSSRRPPVAVAKTGLRQWPRSPSVRLTYLLGRQRGAAHAIKETVFLALGAPHPYVPLCVCLSCPWTGVARDHHPAPCPTSDPCQGGGCSVQFATFISHSGICERPRCGDEGGQQWGQQAGGGCGGSPGPGPSGRERQITEMRRLRGIRRSPKKDSSSRRISWEKSYRTESLRGGKAVRGEGSSPWGNR